MNAFVERNLTATLNLVGLAGTKNPIALKSMIEAGFDLQDHGWRWIDFSKLSENEERPMMKKSVAQIEELTGSPPLGFYAGLPSQHTLKLITECGHFLYSSDTYNDDTPYWSQDHPGLLMMPYSLDTNDSRFGRVENGYQLGEEFVQYIKDSFDRLYKEGEDLPRMLTIGLHARLIGRPGRIGALEQILDYIISFEDVWIARRGDIARHWAAQSPDPYSTRKE